MISSSKPGSLKRRSKVFKNLSGYWDSCVTVGDWMAICATGTGFSKWISTNGALSAGFGHQALPRVPVYATEWVRKLFPYEVLKKKMLTLANLIRFFIIIASPSRSSSWICNSYNPDYSGSSLSTDSCTCFVSLRCFHLLSVRTAILNLLTQY